MEPITPNMDQFCYHHFALNFDKIEIPQKFSDVQLILVAGCWRRALKQAQYLANRLACDHGHQFELEQLTDDVTRFKLYKVGPVLISDHGMGGASMSIALHELLLMCRRANIIDRVTIIRFGTCGGLGIEPGNICITDRAVDPLLNEYVELKIVGKIVRRPCVLDKETNKLIQELLSKEPNFEELGPYEVKIGATMASNDFYEEQGRTNGAICDHTPEDEEQFLTTIRKFGVINVEMESNHLAAMCHKVGVRFAIVCVTLINRLNGDAIHLTPSDIQKFENRLFWTNFLLTKHILNKP